MLLPYRKKTFFIGEGHQVETIGNMCFEPLDYQDLLLEILKKYMTSFVDSDFCYHYPEAYMKYVMRPEIYLAYFESNLGVSKQQAEN